MIPSVKLYFAVINTGDLGYRVIRGRHKEAHSKSTLNVRNAGHRSFAYWPMVI